MVEIQHTFISSVTVRVETSRRDSPKPGFWSERSVEIITDRQLTVRITEMSWTKKSEKYRLDIFVGDHIVTSSRNDDVFPTYADALTKALEYLPKGIKGQLRLENIMEETI